MNNHTSPPTAQSGGRACPVCGKASYSRNGIHPQCAIVQADLPRQQQLAEEKKRESKVKKKKPTQTSWKKKCPKCKMEVHVRLKVCKCGNEF